MTENDRQKLKDAICELVNIAEDADITREVFEMLDNAGVDAIDCLDKLSGYEAIGTIEEFKALKDIKQIADNLSEMERIEYKALKEKNEPKKPEVDEFDYGEGFVCGECESFLHYVDDDDEHIRTNYCCHCGTRIDWSE